MLGDRDGAECPLGGPDSWTELVSAAAHGSIEDLSNHKGPFEERGS